jgi:hypothetical protein
MAKENPHSYQNPHSIRSVHSVRFDFSLPDEMEPVMATHPQGPM